MRFIQRIFFFFCLRSNTQRWPNMGKWEACKTSLFLLFGRGEERKEGGKELRASRSVHDFSWHPNQQRTLDKLSSWAPMQEFLLLSTDRACKSAPKRAKTCVRCVRVPTELPFLHVAVGGWDVFFLYFLNLLSQRIRLVKQKVSLFSCWCERVEICRNGLCVLVFLFFLPLSSLSEEIFASSLTCATWMGTHTHHTGESSLCQVRNERCGKTQGKNTKSKDFFVRS